MNSKPRVLVVGGGSIGERHVRCFLKTDECDVSLCEMDASKRDKIAKTYSVKQTLPDFAHVALGEFDVVVVATPAPFHIPQSLAAARDKIAKTYSVKQTLPDFAH